MLRTPRLALRPIERTDLDSLLALDADPEVMRFINGGTPSPRALYEGGLLDRMLSFRQDEPPRGFFAAHRDGDFVGWFHLRPDVLEPAWLEVGYRLRREAWGQGLATEGTCALLDLARRDEPGRVLSGRTVPGNLGSRRVLEKCGLALAGTFQFPERVVAGLRIPAVDGVLYRTP